LDALGATDQRALRRDLRDRRRLTFAAVSQAGVDNGLVSFIDTGEETQAMGGTAEHRVLLTETFRGAFRAVAHGYARRRNTTGREFVTIDHQGSTAAVGRGLLGLAVFGVLLLLPVVYDLRRIGLGVTREPFAPLSAVYLIVTGATVAFFGPADVHGVTIAIMWSTVALASEIPGERVAGYTFRDEDVSLHSLSVCSVSESHGAVGAMVDIVVVTYNSAATLGAALGPLRGSPLVGRVVVVDNASRDDTRALADESGATVLANERNAVSPRGERGSLTVPIGLRPAPEPDAVLLPEDLGRWRASSRATRGPRHGPL
jgi:hypothetical protein